MTSIVERVREAAHSDGVPWVDYLIVSTEDLRTHRYEPELRDLIASGCIVYDAEDVPSGCVRLVGDGASMDVVYGGGK